MGKLIAHNDPCQLMGGVERTMVLWAGCIQTFLLTNFLVKSITVRGCELKVIGDSVYCSGQGTAAICP